MVYTCYNKAVPRKSEQLWIGEIKHLKSAKNYYEMDVVGRGSSFHVIFGQSSKGGYLCIPEWDVGCRLAAFRDIFWNQEQLEKQLAKVDAITVATAIKEVDLLIKNRTLNISNIK